MGVKNISVTDFAKMRESGSPFTLLDVRRDDELVIAQYPQPFIHIEMNDIADRWHEIPTDKPIIVSCRSGGRSAKVAEQLIELGMNNVSNLDGGILAWGRDVDPSISSY